MQTEPINFKGTKGDFEISPYKFGMIGTYFAAQLKSTVICQIMGNNEEAEANAKLIAASKKMAIALQQICELPQTIGHAYEMQKIAKEALKEAGL